MSRHPASPYVLPFAILLVFIGLQSWLPAYQTSELALCLVSVALVLWLVSRGVIDLRLTRPWSTIAIGAGLFVVWIAPDLLFPHYRQNWLLQNALTGAVRSSLSPQTQSDPIFLVLRFTRAALIVPIAEELFWRAWMMRWLISSDFEAVPLGTYARWSFWVVAVLFASEHGPFWDVGLAAGIVFNWWMIRTKRLGDLIWAHAITNACLGIYVLAAHQWGYWF